MTGPVRFGLAVIGGTVAIVVGIWLCVRAAGTPWALPIVALMFAIVWLADLFAACRPSRLSPLQRFERREAERRRAA